MKTNFDRDYVKTALGKAISKRRQLLGLSQVQFAQRIGMKVPQLCKIETGKNLPGDKVLGVIENGLKIPSGAFRFLREQLAEQSAAHASLPSSRAERLVPTCGRHSMDPQFYRKLVDFVLTTLDQYIQFENQLGIAHHCTLYVDSLPAETEEDAIELSRAIRDILDVGSAPFVTCLPILEQCNMRVIFTDIMPHVNAGGRSAPRSSFSFYDTRDRLPVICVNRKVAVEEQLYHIAYELGQYLHFRWTARHPPAEPAEEWRFCRAFASTLLMPLNRVLYDLEQLSAKPAEWTIEMMEDFSRLYGVSAQSIAWYLRGIAHVFDDELAQKFIEQLKSPGHAQFQPRRPPRPPLPENAWLRVLCDRARAIKAHYQ